MTDGRRESEDLYMADARSLTDEQLRRIKGASDDELMRMSGTAHLVPIVERCGACAKRSRRRRALSSRLTGSAAVLQAAAWREVFTPSSSLVRTSSATPQCAFSAPLR
jgi:hypothetical protein